MNINHFLKIIDYRVESSSEINFVGINNTYPKARTFLSISPKDHDTFAEVIFDATSGNVIDITLTMSENHPKHPDWVYRWVEKPEYIMSLGNDRPNKIIDVESSSDMEEIIARVFAGQDPQVHMVTANLVLTDSDYERLIQVDTSRSIEDNILRIVREYLDERKFIEHIGEICDSMISEGTMNIFDRLDLSGLFDDPEDTKIDQPSTVDHISINGNVTNDDDMSKASDPNNQSMGSSNNVIVVWD